MRELKNIKADTAALALGELNVPFAISEGDGDNLTCIASSALFDEVAAPVADDVNILLRDAFSAQDEGRGPFPGQPDWMLTSTALGVDGTLLWQAQRRPAETAHALVADWVSSVTMGDMGVFFFDPEGRLRAWNGGVRHYFPEATGFPIPGESFDVQLQAILDTYAFEQIGDQRELWRTELTNVFENPGHPSLGVTPGGRWALATATRMADRSTLVFMNDVTEFRDRDQQLKSYMRNAHGILFSRRELQPGGKLTVWGDIKALSKSKPVPGKDASKPTGWYDLIDPRDRAAYIDMMEGRKPEDKPYSIEFRYSLPGSDKIRWMREAGWTTRDSKGDSYLDAIYFDITSAKGTAEALADSTSRFQQFAELASDWYFETDSNDIVSFISDRYEKIAGRSPSEIIGNSFLKQIHGRIAAADEADKEAWQEFGELWHARRPIRNHALCIAGPNGKSLTLETSAEPMFDQDGVFRGYRGIGRDLTSLADARFEALESLSRAEQANESKSAFIANVSHELRTPLNAILGFSSVMADELLGPMGNERYRRYAADIHQSGNHLLSLVNDLLDISKVEAGRYTIEDEQIDLAEEVNRAYTLIEQQASGRELINLCHDADSLLRADRRAIRQVLINIVANAVKFTAGTGSITASTSLASDGRLVLSIEDDGIGIAANELERVLQPFGRATTHIASEGTGLGLPLSRNLIELHDGTLEVDSTPGEGTRIDMYFPPERVLRRDHKALATG